MLWEWNLANKNYGRPSSFTNMKNDTTTKQCSSSFIIRVKLWFQHYQKIDSIMMNLLSQKPKCIENLIQHIKDVGCHSLSVNYIKPATRNLISNNFLTRVKLRLYYETSTKTKSKWFENCIQPIETVGNHSFSWIHMHPHRRQCFSRIFLTTVKSWLQYVFLIESILKNFYSTKSKILWELDWAHPKMWDTTLF